jgi:Caspase domain
MSSRAHLLLLVLCVGCSSIPEGQPPSRIVDTEAEPLNLAVCLVTPRVSLAEDEVPKGYAAADVVDAISLAEELGDWLRANELFESVRVSSSGDDPRPEAWERGEDLLVELEVVDLRATYDGHNGWWIPNLVNWVWWMIPSWFVATEDYTLSGRVEVVVSSVDSGQELYRAQLPVEASGSFNEFDRGWQFLGFISPSNKAENWRLIARALLPATVSRLGQDLTRDLSQGLVPALGQTETRDRMAKTLVVAVGVGDYQDALGCPALPYAASDAEGVALALQTSCGVPAHHVQLLTGSGAKKADVEEALRAAGSRLRPEDQLVVYFAGYGTRDAAGVPRLLCYDSNQAGEGQLSLTELATLLADLPGTQLVVLDSGFDGLGRSIAGGQADPSTQDLAAFADLEAAVALATSAGCPLRAADDTHAGLFTHHFVNALGGGGDANHDGRLTAHELFGAASRRTVADASYFGDRQLPTATGLDAPLVLDLVLGAAESPGAP